MPTSADVLLRGHELLTVAGVRHHRTDIAAVLGATVQFAAGADTLVCELVPEPENPFDPLALAVRIEGWTIGYVPRDRNEEWTPVVNRLRARGSTVRASCFLTWKLDPGQDVDELEAAAHLHLPPPHTVIALNQLPEEAALLPLAELCRAFVLEEHFATVASSFIAAGLEPGRRGCLYFELGFGWRVLPNRMQEPAVELRLDGTSIGLVDGQAVELLPAIRWAEERGVPLFARGYVQWLRETPIVDLAITPADELSPDWLAGRIESAEEA